MRQHSGFLFVAILLTAPASGCRLWDSGKGAAPDSGHAADHDSGAKPIPDAGNECSPDGFCRPIIASSCGNGNFVPVPGRPCSFSAGAAGYCCMPGEQDGGQVAKPDAGPPECFTDCDCMTSMRACAGGVCVDVFGVMPDYTGCPCDDERHCPAGGMGCRNGRCASGGCQPISCEAKCLFGYLTDQYGCPTCECLSEPLLCSSDGTYGILPCPGGYLCVPTGPYLIYPPRIGYCLLQCGPENGEPMPEPVTCPGGTLCREVPGWPMDRAGPAVCLDQCVPEECEPSWRCWYGALYDNTGCPMCDCAPPPACSAIPTRDRCFGTPGCRWEPKECAEGYPCPQCERDPGMMCIWSGGSWTSYSGCVCPQGEKLDVEEGIACVPAGCQGPGCRNVCLDGRERDHASGCFTCECAHPADCRQRQSYECEGLGYCLLRRMPEWSSQIYECVNVCETDDQCPDGWCKLDEDPPHCWPYLE